MASIRKRGHRREVRVRHKNKPTKCKTFTSKADALSWANKTEYLIETEAHTITSPTLSLSGAAARYIDEHMCRHKGAESAGYRLRNIITALGADKSLSGLSSTDIASYRNQRLQEVSSGSVRRELIILSGLFQAAIHEWGYTNIINPVRGVKMPADSPRRTRRLSQCEKDLLLTHAKLKGPRYLFMAIYLALKTGMRQSEIIRLRRSDIDFERCLIELRDTKNGEPRLVPLTQSAMRELRSFYHSDDVVFPVTRSGLQNAFRKTLRRLDIVNLRFHDLRHEAISGFFEQGLSMPEVQLLSGHKTVEQLMRYSHAGIAKVRAKLEASEQSDKQDGFRRVKGKVYSIW